MQVVRRAAARGGDSVERDVREEDSIRRHALAVLDALDAEYCEGAEDSGLRDEAYEDVLAYIREKVER